MKIIRCIGDWFMVCADTARANRGEPIYFPMPSAEYALMPCLSVRMLGVCRCVESGQAGRYVDAISVAFHFCNATLRESLRAASAPLDASYSYDRCIVVGGYTPMGQLSAQGDRPLTLAVGEESMALGSLRLSMDRIGACVAQVTRFVSLNTGDYLLIPLRTEEVAAGRSRRYSLRFGEDCVLDEYAQ